MALLNQDMNFKILIDVETCHGTSLQVFAPFYHQKVNSIGLPSFINLIQY